MFVFHLPEIGEGVVEGEIVQWLVKVGDVVSEDQPVCEIMTDKATVEISTPKGGRVVQLFGKPGDVIKVHSTLANIDTDGSAPRVTVPEIPVPAPVKAAPAPTPLAVVPPAPVAAPAPVVAEVREGNKALATPAVRRHARELELDIHAVPGSGKGGRVTHDDLARFTQPAAEAPAVEAPAAAAEPVIPVAVPQAAPQPTGSETHIPIIGLRRKIAQQMVKAYSTAPHFTYVDEIDMTDLVALRGRLGGLDA